MRCDTGQCIETKTTGDITEIWSTEHPGDVLKVRTAEWDEFLDSVVLNHLRGADVQNRR